MAPWPAATTAAASSSSCWVGVTTIDAYDSYLCTHLLCEDPDCAEVAGAR